MNDCDFTLELSDGTVVRVGATRDAQHPDVRAFHLPPGSLVPFSQQNLPTDPADSRHGNDFAGDALTVAAPVSGGVGFGNDVESAKEPFSSGLRT